jgi:exoribonuclease R
MSVLKLCILKSDYSHFKLIDSTNNHNIEIHNNPDLAKGFFHNDIVKYIKSDSSDNSTSNRLELIERNLPKNIVGLLDLHSNYIYKSGNKNVFMFHPLSPYYPKCYVACSMKHKYSSNVLCSVSVLQWNKDSKLPTANLNHIIGPINDFESISTALLDNYNIGKIPKMNKRTVETSWVTILQELRDTRTTIQYPIYSIDPDGCRDIDDAFSIHEEPNLNSTVIQIHISDVYTLLMKLGFLENIQGSTSIYLPHKQVPMLPEIISGGYGSLLEGNQRLLITLEIRYSYETGDSRFNVFPSVGTITKNYTYDNCPKRFEKFYHIIETVFQRLTQKNYSILDSHNFIECMMLIYNYYFGNHVLEKGLYRVQKEAAIKNDNSLMDVTIDPSLSRFLSIIRSNAATYSLTENYHTSLDMMQYVHVTSPLRRIADLINQEIMYTGSSNLLKYYSVEKINENNKLVKRLVRDINKLHLAYQAYNKGDYDTYCYIFKVNLEKKHCHLYFPRENITIRNDIIPFKIKDITSLSVSEQCIKIENDISTTIIPLFTKIKVHLYGKPDIFHIDNSICIEFIN